MPRNTTLTNASGTFSGGLETACAQCPWMMDSLHQPGADLLKACADGDAIACHMTLPRQETDAEGHEWTYAQTQRPQQCVGAILARDGCEADRDGRRVGLGAAATVRAGRGWG